MWDVFCRVIDNHGDLGVCLRLARQLAASGRAVRLWVDDARALAWMAPDLAAGADHGADRASGDDHQPHGTIKVLDWALAGDAQALAGLATLAADSVWVEAFGCELPEAFVAHGVSQARSMGLAQPAWINLEYLSAEPWVERVHGLPSPIMTGPAKGWVKRFFYPGFTPRTGGLLREHDLLDQQAAFERPAHRARLLGWPSERTPERLSGAGTVAADDETRLISLFCYEPAGLPELLGGWRLGDHLLVTPGRAMDAVKAAVKDARPEAKGQHGQADLPPYVHALPYADQAGFDRLLWACDLNLVRGEDSLVRALWAGQPLVWHIYPQDDHAHHAKLAAFLDWLQAPASLRRFHAVWNSIEPGPLPELSAAHLADWRDCVLQARERLLAQSDLLGQLLDMATRLSE
jgi:uncharacterized repeat protein (TIGR03837 family)